MTGIQITSMLDILERVKVGTLPKQSALVALGAAFPDMNPETAAGMVSPIEVTGPIEESAKSDTPAAPPNGGSSSAAEPSNENGGGVSSPDESGNSNDDGTEGNSV
jgi:hypothetical protein